ncbi:MAG: 23S rRNA (pseudouridine(1915)-N(3))-methyltransferase RlmH [Planctomycetes bacterium]|nr:23S rRNA (pseudouridine(1915)-N(3))-methyltransferase RlmH [Planctomycetota bacterium]
MAMRIVVVQSGRLRDAQIIALRDDYVKRFKRFGSLVVQEREPRDGTALWPDSSRWKVLVDERGDQHGSEAFARLIAQWTMRHGEVAFAVGGAFGHDPATSAGADAHLSLGAMTLPHQLAHVVLIEQVYRAASILAGTAYHHR